MRQFGYLDRLGYSRHWNTWVIGTRKLNNGSRTDDVYKICNGSEFTQENY